MALTYSKQNGYLVPNLKNGRNGRGKAQTLGRFGGAREKYLMEHRKGLYSTMVLNGKLWKHLTEIDKGSAGTGGRADGGDGKEPGRERSPESGQSNGLGAENEQHQAGGGRKSC